jgi:hypothetical protein
VRRRQAARRVLGHAADRSDRCAPRDRRGSPRLAAPGVASRRSTYQGADLAAFSATVIERRMQCSPMRNACRLIWIVAAVAPPRLFLSSTMTTILSELFSVESSTTKRRACSNLQHSSGANGRGRYNSSSRAADKSRGDLPTNHCQRLAPTRAARSPRLAPIMLADPTPDLEAASERGELVLAGRGGSVEEATSWTCLECGAVP